MRHTLLTSTLPVNFGHDHLHPTKQGTTPAEPTLLLRGDYNDIDTRRRQPDRPFFRGHYQLAHSRRFRGQG